MTNSNVLHTGHDDMARVLLAQHVTDYVLKTEDFLRHLSNKRPHANLNGVLHQLVDMVSPIYERSFVDSVLANDNLQKSLPCLRKSLGLCEYALEVYWAEKNIVDQIGYRRYPYISCYDAIVQAEIDLLRQHTDMDNAKICFIGSGPMPITAFEMKARLPSSNMSCVDNSEVAIRLASQVARHSELDVHFIEASAVDIDYCAYDVIAMASMTSGKTEVLERIYQTAKSGALITIRSVEDLRTVLYEPVDMQSIPSCYAYLGKTDYNPSHVNTTLLFRLQK